MIFSINLKAMARLQVGLILLAIFISVSVHGQSGSSTPKIRTMTVQLTGPISTKTSKIGDEIVAQVIEPEEYKGDMLEGIVTVAKSGGSVKGQSELVFRFQKLYHGTEAKNVRTTLKSFTNSKGQEMVDEEGNLIKTENNVKSIVGKSILLGAVGAVIGGVAGGAQGAAIGGAAGAGAAAIASVIYIKHKVQGANVTLGAGSTIKVDVEDCDKCPLEKIAIPPSTPQGKPKLSAEKSARPNLSNRSTEKESITVPPTVLKPAMPATKYRSYTYANIAQIQIPNNWQRIIEDNSVAFAPSGGYVAQPGKVIINYGSRIGFWQRQAETPEQAMKALLTSLQTENIELQQIGQISSTSLLGGSSLTARLRGKSVLNGQIVITDVYLTKLTEGRFFYLLTMVAETDYPAYLEAFLTVRRSLQLN
jgi:hypothetical protein